MASKGKGQILSQSQRLSLSQRFGLDPRQIPYQKYLQMPNSQLREAINELLGGGESANPALERNLSISSNSTQNRKGLTSQQLEEKKWGLKERSGVTASSDSFQNFIEGAIASKPTLKEHLLFQLHIQPLDEEKMKAGELIIGNLDEQGFYQKKPSGETISPEEVLRVNSIFLSEEERHQLLQLIRGFDPIGVCVENQWESLRLQARAKGGFPPSFFSLLEKGEEIFFSNKKGSAIENLNLTEEEIADAKFFLSTLNLNPASEFASEANYIYPEMELSFLNGEPYVFVDDSYAYGLQISNEYVMMATQQGKENLALRKFALAQMEEAKIFLDTLELRKTALMEIGYRLLEFQKDFFLKGTPFLKKLTQKEMAESLNLDETRISRLVNEKWVKTEWGIFPLKYFFSKGGVRYTGERKSPSQENNPEKIFLSPNGVKARILAIQKEFKENMGKNKKLSDQQITDILKGEGIEIARRTVAKYRLDQNRSSF